jgi:molecular chaperone IbpA
MRHTQSQVINTMEELFRDLNRFAIGFEPMIARVTSNPVTYPPYNLTHDEHGYKLELAVAGFKMEELEIYLTNDRILMVRGSKSEDQNSRNWIHRGIAARDFERQFTLAEHIKINSAKLEDGLLIIELEREIPEASKGRVIPISNGNVIDITTSID